MPAFIMVSADKPLYPPLKHQAPFTVKLIFLQNSGLLWTNFIAKLNIEENDLHFSFFSLEDEQLC